MPRQKPFKDLGADVPEVLARRPGQEAGRDRSWDQQNPAISLRIREHDAARLATHAEALGVSKDALGRALLWAALDALDAGELALEVGQVTTEATDRLGRRRIYTRRIAEPARANDRNPNSGDCSGWV